MMNSPAKKVPFWSLLEFINAPVESSSYGVRLEDIDSWTGRLFDNDICDRGDLQGTPFQPGDSLFGKLRPYLAKSWLATTSGVAVGDIHVYRPKRHCEPRFLSYILRTPDFIRFAEGASEGVKMPRSEWSKLRQYPIPLPTLETQQRIADYLDRETAEIDAAVADLDKYVELLEKRRSIITSDALTGADSVKLAHLVRFKNGQDWKDVATPDGEFPVYGSGGEFGRASNFLHDGEAILFGRKGTVDRPIYVDEKFWTVDTMYYAVPNKDKCLGKYIFYWATTIPFETITTNTALPSVTSMDLSQLYVPLPPLESQQRIADYLDRETAEIDSLIADSTKLRDLLLKRRSVLITEVVTGRKQV